MTEAIALPGSILRPRPVRLFSDDHLVNRASKGDERALAAIYDRYHQDLFRYCEATLGNAQDAQDALQNTMVKALQALPGEQREIKLKPWLYRIAHNEAIEVLRRRRPVAQLDEATAPQVQAAPHDSFETRERLRELVSDLGGLPERQRSALVMRELSGMSFDDIGASLGASPAVVRQTIYEARSSLQQMSEGREMSCEEVKHAISDGDGRILRRRDMRAHLRACSSCGDFRAGIATRRRDLAALSPLPATASAGLLHGVLGGAHGGSGSGALAAALGGGTGKAVATSALLKSAAAVLAVTAVGVTAANTTGLIHVGPGSQETDLPAHPNAAKAAATGQAASSRSATGADRQGSGQSASSRSATGADRQGSGKLRKLDQLAGRGAKSEGGKGLHSASTQSSTGAQNQQTKASGEAATIPSAHGGRGTPPAAASHGQQTAASHQPQLPTQAQDHPTATSHPSPQATPPSVASHPAPAKAPPSPPVDPPVAGNSGTSVHGATGHGR